MRAQAAFKRGTRAPSGETLPYRSGSPSRRYCSSQCLTTRTTTRRPLASGKVGWLRAYTVVTNGNHTRNPRCQCPCPASHKPDGEKTRRCMSGFLSFRRGRSISAVPRGLEAPAALFFVEGKNELLDQCNHLFRIPFQFDSLR